MAVLPPRSNSLADGRNCIGLLVDYPAPLVTAAVEVCLLNRARGSDIAARNVFNLRVRLDVLEQFKGEFHIDQEMGSLFVCSRHLAGLCYEIVACLLAARPLLCKYLDREKVGRVACVSSMHQDLAH